MEVKVQSIRFVSDQKLNEFIIQKVNKLSLFFDNILDSEVFLKIDSANKIREAIPISRQELKPKESRIFK